MKKTNFLNAVSRISFTKRNIEGDHYDSRKILLNCVGESDGDPFVFPYESRLFNKYLPCEILITPDEEPISPGIAHWEENRGLLLFKIYISMEIKAFDKVWETKTIDAAYLSVKLEIENSEDLKTPFEFTHHNLESVTFQTKLILDASLSIGKPENFLTVHQMSLYEANLIAFKNISDDIPKRRGLKEYTVRTELVKMGRDRHELYSSFYRNIDHYMLSNKISPYNWEEEYSNAKSIIEELRQHLTIEDLLPETQKQKRGFQDDFFSVLSSNDFYKHVKKPEFWPLSTGLYQQADNYSFQDEYLRIRKLDIHILRALIYEELVENFYSYKTFPYIELIGLIVKPLAYLLPLVFLFLIDKPLVAIAYTILLATLSVNNALKKSNEISFQEQYKELKSYLNSLHLDRESITQAYNHFNKVLNSKNSILKKRICYITADRLFLRLLSNKKYYEETIT